MIRIGIASLLTLAILQITPASARADEATAFTPANPPPMKPIATHDTPAYRAAKLFLRGVNLGNYLEAKGWSVSVSAGEFATMKREGFDHVRVPVAWHLSAGPAPDFTLSPEIFSRADFAVTNALNNKLAVILNLHHFYALDKDPAAATDQFLKMWRQIAAHYRTYPDQLAFELDNEPHENATTELMNPIYAKVIPEIRQTNPKRTLFVEPGGWGNVSELKNLVLPPDDNVIVSVHCYEPFYFTHQGASWAGPDVRQTGIQFPGPPATPLEVDTKLGLKKHVVDWIVNYNTLPAGKNPSGPDLFTSGLKNARAWSDHYGRPVHFGEFGAIVKVDATSRANFYSAFRRAAESESLGWCIWDWSANFRYWDKKTNAPMPGMHEALFEKSK